MNRTVKQKKNVASHRPLLQRAFATRAIPMPIYIKHNENFLYMLIIHEHGIQENVSEKYASTYKRRLSTKGHCHKTTFIRSVIFIKI